MKILSCMKLWKSEGKINYCKSTQDEIRVWKYCDNSHDDDNQWEAKRLIVVEKLQSIKIELADCYETGEFEEVWGCGIAGENENYSLSYACGFSFKSVNLVRRELDAG
ncbi:hypothetical protein RHSIM_Rhsim04G0152000 [Rhododendron simsii]|uniref:Uncharacterized protein n=1 Tax=Rhododendron simsii TaxID=118357 RepID=A0A834H465_RHOSS|nr:hypothetical protein RHSIM_Rhsim04G0152000 [Rhododendron simsii]